MQNFAMETWTLRVVLRGSDTPIAFRVHQTNLNRIKSSLTVSSADLRFVTTHGDDVFINRDHILYTTISANH